MSDTNAICELVVQNFHKTKLFGFYQFKSRLWGLYTNAICERMVAESSEKFNFLLS